MHIPNLFTVLCIVAATALHLNKNDPSDESIDDDLWDGLDLPSEKEDRIIARGNYSRSDKKVYVLLGPEDSGTNLLSVLIRRNFGWLDAHRNKVIWKHSYSDNTKDIYTFLRDHFPKPVEETILIMCVRSPISQITSWKNLPYDTGPCVDRDYDEMKKPCKLELAPSLPDDGRRTPIVAFNSTMDFYNRYLRQYHKLFQEKRFKQVFLFQYENVVIHPEKVLRNLAKAFGMPVPNKPDCVDVSASGGGHGRERALDKVKNRTYLDLLNISDLRLLCKEKDSNLYKKFYIDAWHDSYDLDCNEKRQ